MWTTSPISRCHLGAGFLQLPIWLHLFFIYFCIVSKAQRNMMMLPWFTWHRLSVSCHCFVLVLRCSVSCGILHTKVKLYVQAFTLATTHSMQTVRRSEVLKPAYMQENMVCTREFFSQLPWNYCWCLIMFLFPFWVVSSDSKPIPQSWIMHLEPFQWNHKLLSALDQSLRSPTCLKMRIVPRGSSHHQTSSCE